MTTLNKVTKEQYLNMIDERYPGLKIKIQVTTGNMRSPELLRFVAEECFLNRDLNSDVALITLNKLSRLHETELVSFM